MFDAFVTKFNSNGTALVYSTRLGGSGQDFGFAIAVDGAGSAVVGGKTNSVNFPTKNAFQSSFGGAIDGFVTKLTVTGSQLIYSTYLGGSGQDAVMGLSAQSECVVTGFTGSGDFPTVNPLATNSGSLLQPFVPKFAGGGGRAIYSTYRPNLGSDSSGAGVALDTNGEAFVIYRGGLVEKISSPGDRIILSIDPRSLDPLYVGNVTPIHGLVGFELDFPSPPIALDSRKQLYIGSTTGKALVDKISPADPPSVLQIAPTSGPSLGGTPITISGSGSPAFQQGVTVVLGGAAATVNSVSASSISATTTAHLAGTVDVVVNNPDGGVGVLPNAYTYVCSAGAPTATVSGSATINLGDSTNISADLTGTPPWNLVWSDGLNQSGITSTPVTRTVSPTSTTTYTVITVTDANCAGTASGSAVVEVIVPIVPIVLGPSSLTKAPGDDRTVVISLPAAASANTSAAEGARPLRHPACCANLSA